MFSVSPFLRRALMGSTIAFVLLLGAPLASADTTSWMTGPVPTLGGLSWIAADTGGNVYAYDAYSGMIKKYTGTGTLLGTVGPRTSGLFGLTASPDGGVYTASANAPNPGFTITRYDGGGTAVQTISVASGDGPGQVGRISGFGADGTGNVYILDATNSRVEKFSAGGSYSTQWGSPGDGSGQFDFFNNGGALGVASDGTVYVCDSNNRIQKFTSTGDFLTSWGSTGVGPGQFIMLGSLAVDSAGHLYAADFSQRWAGNGTASGPVIQEFDSSGNYLGSATQGTTSMTTYGDDLVYAIAGNTVYRLELTVPNVTVSLSPLPPPGTPSSVYVSQPLTATATASVPFGSITGYRFDFGAGGPVTAGPSPTATSTYMTGGTYRVTVTVTSSRGGSATASAPVLVHPRSPANASPPSISGTAAEGRVLTELHGTWSYGPVTAYGYHWVRCDRSGAKCTPIAGASGQTYVLRQADVGHRIRVRETATGAGVGAGPFAVSAATAVVKALPKLSALSISPSAFRPAQLGVKIRYRLVSPARVRFTIQRVVGARRFAPVRGSFTVTGRAGNNTFPFSGQLNGRALGSGGYRLVATPIASGITGNARTTGFRILR